MATVQHVDSGLMLHLLHVIRMDVRRPPVLADRDFRGMAEHLQQILPDPTDTLGLGLCNRECEENSRAGDDNMPEPLLGSAELLLQLPALGDVEKGDHGADHLAAAANRIRPVLGWEAGSVSPPENFVVRVRAL